MAHCLGVKQLVIEADHLQLIPCPHVFSSHVYGQFVNGVANIQFRSDSLEGKCFEVTNRKDL